MTDSERCARDIRESEGEPCCAEGSVGLAAIVCLCIAGAIVVLAICWIVWAVTR